MSKTIGILLYLTCLCCPALCADFVVNGLAYEKVSDTPGTVRVVRGGTSVNGEVTIPGSVEHEGIVYCVTAIGDGAFLCCERLEAVILPDEVTHIEERAFYGCKSLNNLSLGNSLEQIGHYAFTDCQQLTTLTFQASLRVIGRAAFRGCIHLSEIHTLSETPPILMGSGFLASFAQTPLSSIVVTTPSGSTANYLSADGWNDFAYITDQSTSQEDILLSVAVSGCGTVSYGDQHVSGKGTWSLERGSTANLIMCPAEEYEMKKVCVNGQDQTGSLSGDTLHCQSLTVNTLVEVEFSPRHAYLTLCHDSNGSLQMDMTEGQTVRLRILPRPGWNLHSVSIDGQDVTEWVDENNYLSIPQAHSGMNIRVVLENNGKYAVWTANGVMTLYESTPTVTVPEEAVAVDLSSLPASRIIPNNNPNTLYIIHHDGVAAEDLSDHNLVIDEHADQIRFTDGFDTFIPFDIAAAEVQYTRTPAIATSGQGGWESIHLPFSVQAVTNGNNGKQLDWFHDDNDSGKDFWLRRLDNITTDNRLVFCNVDEWQANEPYIIAVPDATWGEFYDLRNTPLLFKAENAIIKATEWLMPSSSYQFTGTLSTITVGPAYTLNGIGDAFLLSDVSTVPAFRAYITNGHGIGPARLPIDNTTDMPDAHASSTLPTGAFLINGIAIHTSDNNILPKGLYIINGKKQLVK